MRLHTHLCVVATLTATLTGQELLIPAPGLVAPIGVLSDAQGKIYTASQGDGASVPGSVAVYDPIAATQTVLIANLPTFMAPQQHPVGAHHMAWHPTQPGVLSLVSGGPTGLLEDYDVATGTVNASFDVGTFVAGQSLSSNAYSVANDSAGNRYVVDTGANAIVKVDTAGTLSLFAQFPNLPVTGGIFVGQQFVPTKIVADGNDGFWVGGFTGVPFFGGAASVAHVDSAGAITTPYTGLTTIVDLAVNPRDNSLHALSIGSFDPLNGAWVPGTGEVIRLDPAGNTTVLGGLNMPTGMTFAPNGDLYYVEYLDLVFGPGAGSLSRLACNCSQVLTTTFASNNGQAGNMFDLRPLTDIVLDSFDVNLDSGTWDLEIWTSNVGSHVGVEQDASQWTLIASYSGVTSNGPDVPTPLGGCLELVLTAGSTQGFYVTVSNGTSINYTNSALSVGSLFTSNTDLEFYAGTGNVYAFGGVFGGATSSRIWNGNINYTTGSASLCTLQASKTKFGSGCYDAAASFYEVLTASSMDLGGVTITGTATATGYDISTAPSTWTGAGVGAANLNLGDDDSVDSATVGGTLGVHVGSNGWLALGGGNSTSFTPSVTTMLANPSTAIYAWTDLQPLSGGGSNGDVFYEENGTVATVTFDGVDGWNTADPNSIQFVYDTASGDFSISFGAVSTLNPEDWLVGYSVGGPSLDGGPTDLSAGPFSTPAADASALSLDSNLPELGGSWDLQLDNADGTLAFFFFGDTALDPAYDFAAIGGDGCFGYTNANIDCIMQPVTAGTAVLSINVPNDPSLVGGTLAVQGTAATTLNAMTFATSNGLLASVGY